MGGLQKLAMHGRTLIAWQQDIEIRTRATSVHTLAQALPRSLLYCNTLGLRSKWLEEFPTRRMPQRTGAFTPALAGLHAMLPQTIRCTPTDRPTVEHRIPPRIVPTQSTTTYP